MRLIDLSHPLTHGMPVYPGDPEVTIHPALTVNDDGAAVVRLGMGSHTGTHLDAPAHVIPGGRTVDQIPLDSLMGSVTTLRVARARPGQRIDAAAIAAEIPRRLPSIVCIHAGWDRHFGGPEMNRHPYLALELAELLWERGARVLGVDTLSPDPTEGTGEDLDPAAAGVPVHEFWLGRGGVIVENLRGLEHLPDVAVCSLLPLAITGGDGAPVRAVGWADEVWPGRRHH